MLTINSFITLEVLQRITRHSPETEPPERAEKETYHDTGIVSVDTGVRRTDSTLSGVTLIQRNVPPTLEFVNNKQLRSAIEAGDLDRIRIFIEDGRSESEASARATEPCHFSLMKLLSALAG